MKKKISIFLALTMLLSGCNTVEKAEQTTSEITTTAETTVVTTATTAETTITTLITDISTPSETIATAETENIVKAESFDFNFTLEDFTMDLSIFEKYFYGSWNEQSEYPLRRNFTYQDDSFVDGRYYCLGFYEDETGGYMLTMNGGVHELYFVLADSPDTMYTRMDFNFYYKDIGYCDVYKADKNNSELSRELTAGTLDSMGALKLKVDYGFDIKSFNSFTDDYGTEWVYGLGTLATTDQERYLVSYSEDKVELGIRYFKKSEYDAFIKGKFDDKPEEKILVLVFEKTDGAWQFKNIREYLEEINFLGSEETFMINPLTMISYDTVFFQAEYDETYNSVDNPEMFDENGIFTGKEIYKSECNYKGPFKKANKGDKFGNLTLTKTEIQLQILYESEDSDIKTGVPSHSRAEFDGEVTLDGVLYYADEVDPICRGYMFIPFSSSLKENNLPMLHYYTNLRGYSSNNGFVSTSGRTTHFSLHHSETDTEKMKKILNGNDSAKVRVTLSDIYMYWTYDNGSGYDPYIAKLEAITKINE